MTIKYRIGIMPGPWPAGRDGAGFLWTLCDMLERSDVDSIWLSDRLSSPAPVPEVMTTLAAIAARTTRLKFGPSVVVLPYRTPVVAAKEMATVDWLSQGRLFPAVGVGVELPREFDASGVPFKERGKRTDEAIHVIRLLWTQDDVSFQGEFYKLDRVTIFPKPWQTPPPIWIGGNSARARRRVAELGDGWHTSSLNAAAMAPGWAHLQALWEKHGRQGKPVLSARVELSIEGVSTAVLSYPPRPGRPARMPLSGSVGAIVEQIGAFQEVGVEHLVFETSTQSHDSTLATMEAFMQRVQPQLA